MKTDTADTIASTAPANLMVDVCAQILRRASAPRPLVHSFYLASWIKKALRLDDGMGIMTSTSDIKTIGDCRYALTVTDFQGTKYRITVQVDDAASAETR